MANHENHQQTQQNVDGEGASASGAPGRGQCRGSHRPAHTDTAELIVGWLGANAD